MKNSKKFHSRWILLTGLSGAGKTTALKILEDQGFFAIDNLPVALLPSLIQLLKNSSNSSLPKVVLGMDARGKDFIKSYQQVLARLEESKIRFEILFFDCRKEALIKRFSETRRPHPFRKKGQTLERAIERERESLAPLLEVSSKVIDTSKMSVHHLKRSLHRHLTLSDKVSPLTITLLSFGFKFGTPIEADMLFDVRFLTNPFFVPKLKKRLGTSPSVKDFVMNQKETKVFFRHVLGLIRFLIPSFKQEGKSHLTIAFGCTGGRHRSVAVVEALQKQISRQNCETVKIHRDLGKEA